VRRSEEERKYSVPTRESPVTICIVERGYPRNRINRKYGHSYEDNIGTETIKVIASLSLCQRVCQAARVEELRPRLDNLKFAQSCAPCVKAEEEQCVANGGEIKGGACGRYSDGTKMGGDCLAAKQSPKERRGCRGRFHIVVMALSVLAKAMSGDFGERRNKVKSEKENVTSLESRICKCIGRSDLGCSACA